MPEGLVRTDANNAGVTYRNGNPVPPASPSDNSNPVNWLPSPAHFGNPVPATDPTFNSNPVTWQTPNPAHFGNLVTPSVVSNALLFENGDFILLEDGSGIILLES